MAISKNKINTLKLVAATSVCVFSLLVSFSGAFSWFLMNREVKNTNDSFSIDKKDRLYKVSYHHFVGTPTEDNCSFNKTPYAYITYNSLTKEFDKPRNGADQEIDSFTLEMATYNPMNKYKPVLVLAELDDEYNTASEGAVSVVAKTKTTDFMGKKDNNHLPKYNLGSVAPTMKMETRAGVDYYPLSSVANFRAFGMSESQYQTWASTSNYSVNIADTMAPRNNFTEADNDLDVSTFTQTCDIYSSNPETFSITRKYKVGERVTYNGNVYKCHKAVTITGSWTDNTNWTQISADTNVKYVAIIVDYNDAVIEYIYSAYLGDKTMEDVYLYVLNFLCDWVWEIG